MNERILKLALEAGLLNYVDNETPRKYFIDGNADLEEVEKFAELLIKRCGEEAAFGDPRYYAQHNIHKYFGVE